MNRKTVAATIAAVVLGAAALTACDTDDNDCYSQPAFIYVVGGTYHYGSVHGPTIDRRYVDTRKGTLKPGVSVKPGGKVSLDKSKINTDGKPVGGSKPGNSVKQPSAPKAPAPAPKPAPRVR